MHSLSYSHLHSSVINKVVSSRRKVRVVTLKCSTAKPSPLSLFGFKCVFPHPTWNRNSKTGMFKQIIARVGDYLFLNTCPTPGRTHKTTQSVIKHHFFAPSPKKRAEICVTKGDLGKSRRTGKICTPRCKNQTKIPVSTSIYCTKELHKEPITRYDLKPEFQTKLKSVLDTQQKHHLTLAASRSSQPW